MGVRPIVDRGEGHRFDRKNIDFLIRSRHRQQPLEAPADFFMPAITGEQPAATRGRAGMFAGRSPAQIIVAPDRAGTHRTYVRDIEQGRRNPAIAVVEKLAAPFGVSAAYPLK